MFVWLAKLLIIQYPGECVESRLVPCVQEPTMEYGWVCAGPGPGGEEKAVSSDCGSLRRGLVEADVFASHSK